MARKKRWHSRQACEDILDKRDSFFDKLRKFEEGHGYIPKSYRLDEKLMQQYNIYKVAGSWRNDKKLVKKIRRYKEK